PESEENFIRQIQTLHHEPLKPAMHLLETINAGKFWNPDSIETLIFSNFVGAACVFSYNISDGKIEIIRVNKKYMLEIGMNMTEMDFLASNPWDNFSSENRAVFENAIRKAIEDRDEVTVETWRIFHSTCCGDDTICVRSSIRMIAQADQQYLFYAMVQNVTAEKMDFKKLFESERRFRFASEQANMYAWEYIVATKEMRPCFRCMRDLHLPPLLRNYPESAIEAGIFPPDYAEMYRDWHRQIDAGVPHLEGIIPLTVGRIPFHVRYTTEFDSNGRPVKAYGSATLIVDGGAGDVSGKKA
ncbi:MAG: hypothetical protein K5657_02955, partial [Desulfovibrio sp.]|nr:hypothetical protein [Desulfovibrio sp.]